MEILTALDKDDWFSIVLALFLSIVGIIIITLSIKGYQPIYQRVIAMVVIGNALGIVAVNLDVYYQVRNKIKG